MNTNEKTIKLVYCYENIYKIPEKEKTTGYYGEYSLFYVKNGKSISEQLFSEALNALNITPNELGKFNTCKDFDKALISNLLENKKIVNMIYVYEMVCKLPNSERITENSNDVNIKIKNNQDLNKLRTNLHDASVVLNQSIPNYLDNPKFDDTKEVEKEMEYNLKNNKRINTYISIASKNFKSERPSPNNTEPIL